MPTYAGGVDHVHEAQDLTQAFFAHLLEKQAIGRADRDRGRFRAFLLTALKNYLANEWDKARTEKRGARGPSCRWTSSPASRATDSNRRTC